MNNEEPCGHCLHPYTGISHIVLKPGQRVAVCCQCDELVVVGPHK